MFAAAGKWWAISDVDKKPSSWTAVQGDGRAYLLFFQRVVPRQPVPAAASQEEIVPGQGSSSPATPAHSSIWHEMGADSFSQVSAG